MRYRHPRHRDPGRGEAILGSWTLERPGLEFLSVGPQMGSSACWLGLRERPARILKDADKECFVAGP